MQAERGKGENGRVMRHEMAEQFGGPVQRAQLADEQDGEREPGEGLQAAREVGFHGLLFEAALQPLCCVTLSSRGCQSTGSPRSSLAIISRVMARFTLAIAAMRSLPKRGRLGS